MTRTPPTSKLATLETAAALESVLTDLGAAHEELLSLVREHRKAISTGDAAMLQDCLMRQGMLGTRVAELEKSRRAIASSLTKKTSSTIAELAALLPAEARPGIETAAARLRSVIATVQRENGIVRAATHTLIAHIDGLMQQVARALSHAGTYGRQGRVEGSGPVPCGLDMTH